MALDWLESLKKPAAETSETSAQNQTFQREPLQSLARTCETSVTCKNIATFNLDRDAQGKNPDSAQTIAEHVFNDVSDVSDVQALHSQGLRRNVNNLGDVSHVSAALADTENQSAKTWLADKLATGAQLAIELHHEGELLGFSAGQLEAARLACGGRLSVMTGNIFWWPAANAVLKLAPKIVIDVDECDGELPW